MHGVICLISLDRSLNTIWSITVEWLEDIDHLKKVPSLHMEVLTVDLHVVPGRYGNLPGAVRVVRIFSRIPGRLNCDFLAIVKVGMTSTGKSVNLLHCPWLYRNTSCLEIGWDLRNFRQISSRESQEKQAKDDFHLDVNDVTADTDYLERRGFIHNTQMIKCVLLKLVFCNLALLSSRPLLEGR